MRLVKNTPEKIARLADRCVTHIEKRFNFELDYKYETLGVVDHFIKTVVDEEGEDTVQRSHLIHLLAPTVGAYFGEVVRDRFSCRWRLPGDEAKDWTMEFEEVLLRFNPIGAAAEAFACETIAAWGGSIATAPEDTELLTERLAASPPVLESDFFALTTRWEVLEIAEDWLKSRYADDNNRQPQKYSQLDYDHIFQQPDI